MSAPSLTGSQKSFLRGLGQTMQPTLKIGKAGTTDAFFHELDLVLDSNELVKMRFVGTDRAERDALIAGIVEKGRCELAGQIGQTALFYRQQPDGAKRRVVFE